MIYNTCPPSSHLFLFCFIYFCLRLAGDINKLLAVSVVGLETGSVQGQNDKMNNQISSIINVSHLRVNKREIISGTCGIQ